MARSYLLVANWKMHFTPAEASVHLHRLDQEIESKEGVEVVLCPPFVDLYSSAKELNKAKFGLGAQNLHWEDEGAFTGEVSGPMLKGLADYVIVGHSERRRWQHEDDKLIAKKVAAAIRHDITPVLCVGDNLLDRQHGAARKVVTEQVENGLSQLTAEEASQLVITYEPVWAISSGDGHGDYAKPEEVTPMIKAIRQTVAELFEGDDQLRVLYGGSANPDNLPAYLELPGVDGLLIGGASLNYAEFAGMVKAAQQLAG